MNKLFLPVIAFAILTLNSCEVTIGDSDSKKEIKNGFSYEEVECSLNGSFPISNNEIYSGTTLYTVFTGVSNATLKDDFQHVGIGFKLYNEQGEVILEKEDLLDNIEQQDPLLTEFSAFYTVPDNIEEGTKAKFVFTLFDKYGSISYDYERNFTVVHKTTPATKGCKIESNIASKSNIVAKLYNGHFQYKNVPIEINRTESLNLMLYNIKEFTPIDGVFIVNYTVRLMAFGEHILEQTGDFTLTKEQFDLAPFYANQNFNSIPKNVILPKNVTWEITFKDVNSDKYVRVSTDIIFTN